MNVPSPAMTYRPEIDGLRAIAVLPVMLFHAGFSAFSGGYVGVDIFFVLSGYLITSIILGEAERGEFSLLRFYERRARRILPALLLVVLATLPMAYFWMTQGQWEDFAESLVGVAGFASNLVFWLQTDYFATASELKPLLHTWSLAVEEQFYIIFPLLVLLVLRINRRALLPVFIISALVSLGWSEYAARAYPSANFYLLPSRAWELLAGACCALMLRQAGVGQTGVGQEGMAKPAMPLTPPEDGTAQKRVWNVLQLPQPLQHMAAFGGLAAIITAITIFDGDTPFPSLYALLPVGGTMALILFLHPDFWLTRLLAVKPLVAIGLVSYGAYLWHQPILAFYRMTTFVHQPVMLALLLVLSLILAAISYWLVEQPVRYTFLKNRSHKAFLALSALALAAIGALGFAGRFLPVDLPHERATGFAQYSGEGYDWRARFAGDNDKAAPIILYGDSVARQYIGGLRSDAEAGGAALDFIGAPSCVSLPRAFSSKDGKIPAQCRENINLLYDMVTAQPGSVVIIGQDWHVRLQRENGAAIGLGGVPADPLASEALIFNLELIATRLPAGSRLVLIGQVPSTQDGGDMLSAGPSRCAQFGDVNCPRRVPRQLVTAAGTNKRLARLAARFAHVGFVDPMASLCDDKVCHFWKDDKPLYYDNSHLTAFAADRIAQEAAAVAKGLTPKAE